MEIVDYTGAYEAFIERISTVQRLQERTNADGALDDAELDLLFESLFMSVFRAFENYVEHCFIFSMQGMADMAGRVIPRFAEPGDRKHARDMLMGSQTVLDWTTSTTILRRHDVFMKDVDSGIRLGITDISSVLSTAKDLRNHIAHNSDESESRYSRVIATFHPTPPLATPTPGALLRTTPTVGPAKSRQVLTYLRERFLAAAKAISGAP